MKTRTFLKAIGLGLAYPAVRALASDGGRPIRLVVPLPPGSSNDTAARAIARLMSESLGQPVVIDNKAGASGVIGAMDVARASPDGLTLMCGSLSPLATNVAFVKDLPYDPLQRFTPIAGATMTNHVLVVAANSPIRSVADFFTTARAQPGKISIGYSTSIAQLQIKSMEKMAGVQLLGVPYKGVPASVTDVMGGSLTATLANPGPTIAMVKGGQLRALSVSSLKRNPGTPDWPALSETLPGFDFPSWNAFVGPAGLSRDVVARLNAAVTAAQKNPDVVRQLASEATLPWVKSPEELHAYMQAEVAKYVRLAKEAGIEPA